MGRVDKSILVQFKKCLFYGTGQKKIGDKSVREQSLKYWWENYEIRDQNDGRNSTVPKIGLCRKMEGYSSKMGWDDKNGIVQF